MLKCFLSTVDVSTVQVVKNHRFGPFLLMYHLGVVVSASLGEPQPTAQVQIAAFRPPPSRQRPGKGGSFTKTECPRWRGHARASTGTSKALATGFGDNHSLVTAVSMATPHPPSPSSTTSSFFLSLPITFLQCLARPTFSLLSLSFLLSLLPPYSLSHSPFPTPSFPFSLNLTFHLALPPSPPSSASTTTFFLSLHSFLSCLLPPRSPSSLSSITTSSFLLPSSPCTTPIFSLLFHSSSSPLSIRPSFPSIYDTILLNLPHHFFLSLLHTHSFSLLHPSPPLFFAPHPPSAPFAVSSSPSSTPYSFLSLLALSFFLSLRHSYFFALHHTLLPPLPSTTSTFSSPPPPPPPTTTTPSSFSFLPPSTTPPPSSPSTTSSSFFSSTTTTLPPSPPPPHPPPSSSPPPAPPSFPPPPPPPPPSPTRNRNSAFRTRQTDF
ncbi:hypothetical protein C7M84_014930 [Penaeus vannamei]|uniref:Uncharacterized protein n=1 Tax=Penaeus vannamei TaxID=6689 RepID=A0A3R7MPU8_PENVA|nr:hypothetical protein C7M84_014930 [Penaeus vannamei]